MCLPTARTKEVGTHAPITRLPQLRLLLGRRKITQSSLARRGGGLHLFNFIAQVCSGRSVRNVNLLVARCVGGRPSHQGAVYFTLDSQLTLSPNIIHPFFHREGDRAQTEPSHHPPIPGRRALSTSTRPFSTQRLARQICCSSHANSQSTPPCPVGVNGVSISAHPLRSGGAVFTPYPAQAWGEPTLDYSLGWMVEIGFTLARWGGAFFFFGWGC